MGEREMIEGRLRMLNEVCNILKPLSNHAYPSCLDPAELAEGIAVRFIARGITIERQREQIKALTADIRARQPEETPLGDDIDGVYPV